MLGDPHLPGRQLQHLPTPGHCSALCAGIGATTAAAPGLVHDDLVWVGDLRQRPPGMSRLPAGFASGLTPQRLRCRFGQPVGRRRLRGVPRVRPQLGRQLPNLPSQLLILRPKFCQLAAQSHNQREEFLDGRLAHEHILASPKQHADATRRRIANKFAGSYVTALSPQAPDQLPWENEGDPLMQGSSLWYATHPPSMKPSTSI